MMDQEPEYDLDEYNGDSLLITAAVFLAFSWISVILRIYTRTVLMKSFQMDDWFMFAAQVSRIIMRHYQSKRKLEPNITDDFSLSSPHHALSSCVV